jgi:hypothetical protein
MFRMELKNNFFGFFAHCRAKNLLMSFIDFMSHNLVQELVQEMGPNNPALNGGMGAPAYAGMMPPQGQMPMMQPQMPMLGQQMPMMQPQGQAHAFHHQRLPPQQMGPDPADEQQMHEMLNLGQYGMDETHRPVSDRLMDRGREALFLAIVFFLLSLPQTDQFLQRMVPQVGSNFYLLLVSKGALLALAFLVARYFEII